VAALAVLGAALAVAPSASAQEQVYPQFSLGNENAVYPKGSEFTVTIQEGTCPGGPVSLTSPGFVAPVDLTTLRGRFIDSGGPHSATLKCKDTTIAGSAPFFLSDPDANHVAFLDKDEYAPGETIKIDGRGLPSGCRSFVATSEGFVATVQLRRDADNVPRGEGKAIDTPGSYKAWILCGLAGDRFDRFTIKVPAPTSPPTTKPPVRKPPIIKPKGAADTGGGGTA
jgi:hypothetical protein